jgi:hypothetical protein
MISCFDIVTSPPDSTEKLWVSSPPSLMVAV